MRRVRLCFEMLLVACVIAGAYGAIHNQISYTISPDFFEYNLFPRFRIPTHLENRIGAAFVGILGTWWMGIVTGAPVILLCLAFCQEQTKIRPRILMAFGFVLTTAAIIGLLGLGWAFATPATSRSARVTASIRAGQMHDFSYLGGCIGIVTASAFLIRPGLRRRSFRPGSGCQNGSKRF